MERKFESEMAGQVAQRHRNPLRSRAKVLVLTLVSCAVMVAAAGAVLSMNASAELGGPTVYKTLLTGEDYLVCVDGVPTYTAEVPVDENILVKRTSELKGTELNTPGNSPIDYTKWNYSVNLKMRNLDLFAGGIAGTVVSVATVDGLVSDLGPIYPWVTNAGLAVDGVPVLEADGTPLDDLKFATVLTSEGTMTITMTLPDLSDYGVAYEDGTFVSMFVMLKTPFTGLVDMSTEEVTEPVSEVGFPYAPRIE